MQTQEGMRHEGEFLNPLLLQTDRLGGCLGALILPIGELVIH